jgi:post-segregation antitoxin CcdA
MSRRKVTLRLNSDVVERAKNAGMNLSYFLEIFGRNASGEE